MKNRNFFLRTVMIILLVLSTRVIGMELVYDTTLSPGTTIELLVSGVGFASAHWGDGTSDHLGTTTQHTYAAEGTYTVTIDASIEQFGYQGAYATGIEKLIQVNSLFQVTQSLEGAFAGAVNLTTLNDIPRTEVTDYSRMFMGATSFNQQIAFPTSNVVYMNQMFAGATAFDQDLSSWSFRSDVKLVNMFENAGLSTPNYDALLIQLSNRGVTNTSFNGGSSKYSPGAAAAARQSLIDNSVQIFDGGLIIPVNVSISVSGNDAVLSWDDMGATSYNIYRSTEPYPADWDMPLGVASSNTYTDVGAGSGTKYFYYVTVVD